ncbi:HD domain-containing phosphohydrolase [Desulfopila aestuarii]|uniref:HAMP domain-containing protein n=1 Tax=Desulfopila aestuarii DSM 18488 TaxID=1121416 RepID=A0A1M7Y3J4_9BACT|nr:HD domain-containing phosphohydrolase [Desulfopila aestuarii]SHO46760.1 HAMP domain-containing protein [Desulfopila aestuarii DSM 18488]
MISVLFISLVVLFGLFFRQFIYWQTSNLLIEESKRIFSRINRELAQSYLTTRKTIGQAVHMLAATDLPNASTLEERLSFLPILQAALTQEPNLTDLEVGYATGDYFIVRPLIDDHMRRQFNAPEEATLVVDNIVRPPYGKPQMQRIWMNDKLSEIASTEPEPTDYDPRLRPWYIEAINSDKAITTAPYLFHFVRQMGVTIAFMPEGEKAVVAGDVTLFHLSQLLAQYQLTPRSELILLEKTDNDYLVVAYRDPQKLLTQMNGNPERSKVINLDSAVINHAAKLPNILDPFVQFTLNDENWLGSTKKLDLPQDSNLYLVMLSPENELLLEAKRIREQTLKYSLAMILLSIPLTYLLARKISRPIQLLANETSRISRFEFITDPLSPSTITEVDELSRAMTMMETTIGQFLALIKSLAGEHNLDRLLDLITQETMTACEARAAMTFIVNETTKQLEPKIFRQHGDGPGQQITFTNIEPFPIQDESELLCILKSCKGNIFAANRLEKLDVVIDPLGLRNPQVFVQPLINRQGDSIGLLALVYDESDGIETPKQQGKRAFIETLSGFAAVTLESRRMLKMQKDLLDSFIQLLAGAIDSKSPYTGGHCQRVPVLTELLARKACEATDGPFAGFCLTAEEWEEIRIASWLHDCGKVTTPEFVVDKATKLETIYDRIHEIRMRFEVAKREVQVRSWQQIAEGGDREQILTDLEHEWNLLDEEYSFIADCNLGGEFMDQEKIDRLQQIATRHWMRTIDDRIGISWEELQRKERTPAHPLPVMEPILADRDDHIHLRGENDKINTDNPYGFRLDVPEYLYNKGELYNLSIHKGTLTAEDRYKINDHIVQSIIMLKQLPYPKHLANVPDIAGSHHEKIDGTGYPRMLKGTEMSIPARMMVIADIFEALTASDRPYKKAKPISDAIRILALMEKDQHIDPDLFRLFLTSGAYLEYAREYLQPEQIDEVDLTPYLKA